MKRKLKRRRTKTQRQRQKKWFSSSWGLVKAFALVFSQQTLSDQLPLPEPCHGQQNCFFFIGALLSHRPFDAGKEMGPSPSPKSIFATITQKQEEMANWREAEGLMMQYNGHLPIQKQTNGHERMLNNICTLSSAHKSGMHLFNLWCFEAVAKGPSPASSLR